MSDDGPRSHHLEEQLNPDDPAEWSTLMDLRLQQPHFQDRTWEDVHAIASSPDSDPIDRMAAFTWLYAQRAMTDDASSDIPEMTGISPQHQQWLRGIEAFDFEEESTFE